MWGYYSRLVVAPEDYPYSNYMNSSEGREERGYDIRRVLENFPKGIVEYQSFVEEINEYDAKPKKVARKRKPSSGRSKSK